MANYKRGRNITIAGCKFVLTQSDIFVEITEQTQGSNAADAMQKASSVYTVATGKSFIALGVRIWTDATGGGTLAIWQGDTEDSLTVLKYTVDVPFIPNLMGYEVLLNPNPVFSAGKFITIVPSSTVVDHIDIIGYEV